ncbi:MAG: hypothetical protein V3T17_12885 [Pseudomonadales bacterium]
MTKPIAVSGNVIATPGTTPFSPADSGAWVAQPVQEIPYPKLKIGGKNALQKVICVFQFAGVQSASGAPVSGVETVILEPQKTAVKHSGQTMLLDGDKKDGQYGNKLQAIAFGKMKTS